MAETILMIHGMWGAGWYWENFKGFFEKKGYRCVVPTLRFHDMNPNGVPDPRLGTTSLLDYVEDLEKLIRELQVMPILMGHSMGGLLAQILSSRGLAKAIVLLTPASPHGIIALKPSVRVAPRTKIGDGFTLRWRAAKNKTRIESSMLAEFSGKGER